MERWLRRTYRKGFTLTAWGPGASRCPYGAEGQTQGSWDGQGGAFWEAEPEHAAGELGASGGGQRFRGAGPAAGFVVGSGQRDPEGGHEGLWAAWWLHSELFSRLPCHLKDERARTL